MKECKKFKGSHAERRFLYETICYACIVLAIAGKTMDAA